jgi:hypothetical protein
MALVCTDVQTCPMKHAAHDLATGLVRMLRRIVFTTSAYARMTKLLFLRVS